MALLRLGDSRRLTGPPVIVTPQRPGGRDPEYIGGFNSEGATNGATVTVGDSYTATVSAVGTGAGANTVAYDTTHVHGGSLAVKMQTGGTSTTCNFGWAITPTFVLNVRTYLWLDANPTAVFRAIRMRHGTSLLGAAAITALGAVQIQDSTGGIVATGSAGTMALGAFSRIETFIDTGRGYMSISVYTGANLEGTGPPDAFLEGTGDFGDDTIDDLQHTLLQLNQGPIWFDDTNWSTTAALGPAPATVSGAVDMRSVGTQDTAGSMVALGRPEMRLAGRADVAATVQVKGQADQRGRGRSDTAASLTTSGVTDQRGRGRQEALGTVVTSGITDMRSRGRQDTLGKIVTSGIADQRSAGRAELVAKLVIGAANDDRSRGRQELNASVLAAGIQGIPDQRSRGRSDTAGLVVTMGQADMRSRGRQEALARLTVPALADQRSRGRQETVGKLVTAGAADMRARGRQEALARLVTAGATDHRGRGFVEVLATAAPPSRIVDQAGNVTGRDLAGRATGAELVGVGAGSEAAARSVTPTASSGVTGSE